MNSNINYIVKQLGRYNVKNKNNYIINKRRDTFPIH